eukprot:7869178-Pyramimonas_sp.AAC.1
MPRGLSTEYRLRIRLHSAERGNPGSWAPCVVSGLGYPGLIHSGSAPVYSKTVGRWDFTPQGIAKARVSDASTF